MKNLIIGFLVICVILLAGMVLLSFVEPHGVTKEEYDQVWNWLTCEECSDEEWEMVRRFGDRAVPLLKNLNGPLSANRRENMARRYGNLWTRIPSPKSDSTDFVDRRIKNLESVIQRRAIIALWKLDPAGGLDEVAAKALLDSLPGDVLGEYQRIVMANQPAVPATETLRLIGPKGVFTMPWVRLCRTAPPVHRIPAAGRCYSYDDPRPNTSMLMTEDNVQRFYVWPALPVGFHEIDPGPLPSGEPILLWVVAGGGPYEFNF